MFLILSFEHSGPDVLAWWRPDSRGYTHDVEAAGRYSLEDARRIVDNAGGREAVVPELVAVAVSRRAVLLREDILEAMREEAVEYHGLDPALFPDKQARRWR